MQITTRVIKTPGYERVGSYPLISLAVANAVRIRLGSRLVIRGVERGSEVGLYHSVI